MIMTLMQNISQTLKIFLMIGLKTSQFKKAKGLSITQTSG